MWFLSWKNRCGGLKQTRVAGEEALRFFTESKNVYVAK
jgi:hypothetical protein